MANKTVRTVRLQRLERAYIMADEYCAIGFFICVLKAPFARFGPGKENVNVYTYWRARERVGTPSRRMR